MTAPLRTSTVEMPREEWLAIRSTGIGSSDAASVVGLNPYKSNYALYEEKAGLREADDLSDNEAVRWGTILEEPIAQEFARRTGRKVRRVNAILRHPDYPFMLANLDRELVVEDCGEPEILECKTAGVWAANSEEWGPDESDEVPERYIIQVQHQLAVRGRKRAYLAALIGGQQLRIYTIRRNDELITALIARETEFWRQVTTRTAPTLLELSDARRLFPVSHEGEIEATAEVFDAVLRLRQAKREEKSNGSEARRLQGIIAGFMQENDTLVRGGRKILTWKTVERKAYSVAASSSRQFRLVGEAGEE